MKFNFYFYSNQAIDISPHSLAIDNLREALLNLDYLIPKDHSITILSHPRLNSNVLFDVIRHSMLIWIFLLLSMLLYTLIIYLINYLNNKSKTNLIFNRKDNSILHSGLDLFSLFMGQMIVNWPYDRYRNNSNYNRFTLLPLRFSLIIWLFGSLLLLFLITTDALSVILSGMLDKIDSFDQLSEKSKHEHYQVIFVSNNNKEEFLKQVKSLIGKLNVFNYELNYLMENRK